MKKLWLPVFVCVGGVMGWWLVPSKAAPPPSRDNHTRWEYKSINLNGGDDTSKWDETLRKPGEDGWELASEPVEVAEAPKGSTFRIILKRAK